MMSGWLWDLTELSTFVCLALTLWFSIYLLSRSQANHLTFRAIVALIALAFYFNSALNALTTNTPDQSQVRSFTITVALIACHDLTHYLLNPQQRKVLYPVARGIVMAGVIVIIMIFTAPANTACNPAYVCPASPAFPWLVIDLFDIFIFGSIFYNLWMIKRAESLLKNVGFYLCVLTGLGAVLSGIIGTAFHINLPRFIPNLLILAGMLALAYSVAHDRTLVSDRISGFDLPITLASMVILVIVYILAGRRLGLSTNDLFLLSVLAIFTHSAYDFVRDFLSHLIHRKERKIRQEFHAMVREASKDDSMNRYLSRGLAILCHNLKASCGFIAARQQEQYLVVASLHSLPVGSPFPSKQVSLEGLSQPASAVFPRIAWLAPAYLGTEQVGLVGIGARDDKVPYSEEDLYWLEDIADEIGEIIQTGEHNETTAVREPTSAVVAKSPEPAPPFRQGYLLSAIAYRPDIELVKCIEEGYRHLNDYDILGKSPLVSIFGVNGKDHLECGKLVHERLEQMLEELKPPGKPPSEPLPSEWHAYTILHDSYVNEELSRRIMARLYIGEGTYYRLRRQALRGITRALMETGSIMQVQ